MAASNIERELERVFNLLMRAAFLLVIQMVKRKFQRTATRQALTLCQDAIPILNRLIAPAGRSK